MWLINTTTHRLHENPPSAVYAILSHTWKTCEIAKASGIEWAWVDTCCIDKSSSAELTESINSMWRWYKNATICYAFLSDLSISNSIVDPFQQSRATFEDLKTCRWFTRGWTLQELLAPACIDLLDSTWKQCGTKASLRDELSILTGIHLEVLGDSGLVYQAPVACRMSWAACRQTTRDEDRAYSLFGIFDVNLPLIYGEGVKAFTRLQEAILQNSTDLSIFAWDASGNRQLYTGLLARSPSDYADCGGVRPCVNVTYERLSDIQITNKGINLTSSCVELVGKPVDSIEIGDSWLSNSYPRERPQILGVIPRTRGRFMHLIDLEHEWFDGLRVYRIYLMVFQAPYFFVRQRRRLLRQPVSGGIIGRLAYEIPRHLSADESRKIAFDLNHVFSINFHVESSSNCTLQQPQCYPPNLWNHVHKTITPHGTDGFIAVLSISLKETTHKTGTSELAEGYQRTPVLYPAFGVVLGLKVGRNGTKDLRSWAHLPTKMESTAMESIEGRRYSAENTHEAFRSISKHFVEEPTAAMEEMFFSTSSGPYTLKPDPLVAETDVTQSYERLKHSIDVRASVDTYRDMDGVTEHEVSISVASALRRLKEPVVVESLGLDKVI
ncbi:hypothetical protein CSUB01_10013 [Colletotrichum sublineola]|uniref:Uncharacterized protein n=1 Tax=Colletotrichum sublineola TaxID=1173701 RepID=A0A066X8C7_COLSU|nr:hypothetical protein CSUB01_10013 [Colletotrichum sublineola]